MSGLFAAAFLRQIGWDVDVYERSPVELVGRGAGITTHPELLEALEKSGAGTRDLGIEVSKRITIDRAGSRHRRAAAAADPHLLGSPAAAAARDHRPCALPPRPHLRARRAGRQRGARPFRRRSRRACRPAGRRRRHPLRRARAGRAASAADLCRLLHLARRAERGRPGAARRCASIFPYFVFFLPRAPAGDRLSDLGLQQRPAPRPPALQFHLVPGRRCADAQATCASTKAAVSTNSRCRRR